MANMTSLLQRLRFIPIGILIEPFVKQTQQYGYHLVDIEMLIVLSKHQRLNEKHALLLLKLLGKICIRDPAFSRAACVPLLILVNRFTASSEDAIVFVEGLTRFVFVSLNRAVEGSNLKSTFVFLS